MNEKALSEQVHRLQQEISIGAGETDRRLLELRAEIDRLRLEVRALQGFLGSAISDFDTRYPDILARTIHEVDPESD